MSIITFLGTGTSQGVPVIGCHCSVCTSDDHRDNRLRSSVIIEENSKKILIDAGPDFREQLLRESIDEVDAILLTHEHKDHTGGLDDLRAISFRKRRLIPIYCEERVLNSLKKEYSYAFSTNPYPGAPQFDIHIIENKPFEVMGVTITPIRVKHMVLPILGFRIGDISYITDASHIEESELDKVKGSSLFVLNSVRREPHISHFSLDQAIEVFKKSGVKECYLTHLSHQIGRHSELAQQLPFGIAPAYDGLKIDTHHSPPTK